MLNDDVEQWRCGHQGSGGGWGSLLQFYGWGALVGLGPFEVSDLLCLMFYLGFDAWAVSCLLWLMFYLSFDSWGVGL